MSRKDVRAPSSIGGRVTSSDGIPIADARVMIADGPLHIDIAALTNKDGRFLLDNLCSGTYKVLICGDNFEPVTVTVILQDQDFVDQEIQVT